MELGTHTRAPRPMYAAMPHSIPDLGNLLGGLSNRLPLSNKPLGSESLPNGRTTPGKEQYTLLRRRPCPNRKYGRKNKKYEKGSGMLKQQGNEQLTATNLDPQPCPVTVIEPTVCLRRDEPEVEEDQVLDLSVKSSAKPAQVDAVSSTAPEGAADRESHDSLPEPPVSSAPPFGYENVDNALIPFLIRGDTRYVSVSTFEDKLLLKYPIQYPSYLAEKRHIICHPATYYEVNLLNRLQDSNGESGPLIVGDLIVPIDDIVTFYKDLKSWFDSMPVEERPERSCAVTGTWVQLNDRVIPFIKRLSTQVCRLLPLDVIRSAAMLLEDVNNCSLTATEDERQLLNTLCSRAGIDFVFTTGIKLIPLASLLYNLNWTDNIIFMLNYENPFFRDFPPAPSSFISSSMSQPPGPNSPKSAEPLTGAAHSISQTSQCQQELEPLKAISTSIAQTPGRQQAHESVSPCVVQIPECQQALEPVETVPPAVDRARECQQNVETVQAVSPSVAKSPERRQLLEHLEAVSPASIQSAEHQQVTERRVSEEPKQTESSGKTTLSLAEILSSKSPENPTTITTPHKRISDRIDASTNSTRKSPRHRHITKSATCTRTKACDCNFPTVGELVTDINSAPRLHNRPRLFKMEICRHMPKRKPGIQPVGIHPKLKTKAGAKCTISATQDTSEAAGVTSLPAADAR